MDGRELDLHAGAELLGDIAKRRVALTKFADRAEVSTVLLVVDHNWPMTGPPLIFETMTFVDGEGTMWGRAPTRAAALSMHDQACADVRETLAGFDAAMSELGVV